MSLISDVSNDLKNLKTGKKELQKFGWLIGFLVVFYCAYIFFKHGVFALQGILPLVGAAILILATILPVSLKYIYKIWMAIAFILGWLVSRILIIFIFSFLITPIGLLLRAIGKSPLDILFKDGKNSYWIAKKSRDNHYEKLY
ncbi:MAG: hypothetical protein HYV28_03060 [Ignavibacteriales bacterium]|nr:hypothetical protein [Ignavibacteriales bacterium]